jgi:hypothetical protein
VVSSLQVENDSRPPSGHQVRPGRAKSSLGPAQPRLVGVFARDEFAAVEDLRGLLNRRPRLDQGCLGRKLALDAGELGPAPLVGLARVQVGAQGDPRADRVPVRADPVDVGGAGRVLLAEIAGQLRVALVGGLRRARELGRQRADAVRRDQRVVCPDSCVVLGLRRGAEGLSARRGQAPAQALVQAGLPGREHDRDGRQAGRDVAPGRVAVAREQVDAVPEGGDPPDRRAQFAQRLARRLPGSLRLEPLAQENRGDPVCIAGERQRGQRGQRPRDQLGPGRVPVRAVVGHGTERPGKPRIPAATGSSAAHWLR